MHLSCLPLGFGSATAAPHPASPSHPARNPASLLQNQIAFMSSSGNIFAALAKTKKKSKPKADSDEKAAESKVDKHAELEAAIFSGPSGTGLSNWADDSEEEEEEWGAQPHHAGEEGWSEVRAAPAIGNAAAPNIVSARPVHHSPACRTCPPSLAGQGRLHSGCIWLRCAE